MTICLYKAYTPGMRNRYVQSFEEIKKKNLKFFLTYNRHIKKGHNNRGIITSQHRGSGHKCLYCQIYFQRNEKNIPGKIKTIEYDPNLNTYICLINYENGNK